MSLIGTTLEPSGWKAGDNEPGRFGGTPLPLSVRRRRPLRVGSARCIEHRFQLSGAFFYVS